MRSARLGASGAASPSACASAKRTGRVASETAVPREPELVTTRVDHERGVARERRNVGERGERDSSVADEARDRR